MKKEDFAGDKKFGRHLLQAAERKAIDAVVPHIPKPIETYHLTLATIPISILIVIFSFLARENLNWLWLVSLMIAIQYVTDSLDGSLGRYRNTGLVRWGYYMDHLLDYFFLCSILIGYGLLLPNEFHFLQLFVLAIFGAFMVNSYLAFAASNRFQISYLGIGPTEVRAIFILVNTLLILFGKTYVAVALPYILVASFVGLCLVVYRTGKELWRMDMEKKKSGNKLIK